MAGMSVEHSVRLERGNAAGVSEPVLEGGRPGAAARRRRTRPPVRPGPRRELIAFNRLGRAVFSPMLAQQRRPVDFGRFVFLDPLAQGFSRDWESAAQQTVAILRAEAGRSPHDRALTVLVGELATRSGPFRGLWASHDVREHRTGVKAITHPVVGDLDRDFEALDPSSDRGLQLIAYSTAPGSPSRDALALLASWADAPAEAPLP
jgi:hypothetical protein